MTTNTPYANLTLFDSTTDQASTFLNYRLVQSGPTDSNMTKIDTILSTQASQIATLFNTKGAIHVPLTMDSAYYYTATGITEITAYQINMKIIVKLDTTNAGSLSININSLGTKSMLKVDSTGALVNIAASNLVKNREYVFIYDGTQFIWVAASSGDQISMAGTTGNFVGVSSTGSLVDSGSKATDFALTGVVSTGWNNVPSATTYVTGYTVTCAGDQTSLYTKGLKIKWIDGVLTGYGIVLYSSYATSTTTVYIIPNATYVFHAGIIGFWYSLGTPQDFPLTIIDSREKLIANRIYYVRTDGNDSNSGLSNTSTGAFLTLQRAWDIVSKTLDLGGWTATIQIGDGTYTAGVLATSDSVGGEIIFLGNAGTPTNVLVSVASGNCFNFNCRTSVTLQSLKVAAAAGYGVIGQYGSRITVGTGMDFGVCSVAHLRATFGARIFSSSNYTISGGSQYHITAYLAALVELSGGTITLTGTPAFSGAFIYIASDATASVSSTFSGSATGYRYITATGGQLFPSSTSDTYFPEIFQVLLVILFLSMAGILRTVCGLILMQLNLQ